MNVRSINYAKQLNLSNNFSNSTEFNYRYNRTKPAENDSVSFQALPRWEIPKKERGWLGKRLFGSLFTPAVLWAKEHGFSFVPAMENELPRVDPQSIDTEKLPEKAGFKILPGNTGYIKGNLVVTGINPDTLENESVKINEGMLEEIANDYCNATHSAPLLENKAIVYVDVYDLKRHDGYISTIKDIDSGEIIYMAQGNRLNIYRGSGKYSIKAPDIQNRGDFRCYTADKSSDYVTQTQKVALEENLVVTFPDGIQKKLEDIYNDGENVIIGGDIPLELCYAYKDKNGTLYEESSIEKNLVKMYDSDIKKECYALSDDFEICTIDKTKLPNEQAFYFYKYKPTIRKVIELPYGTVINCGNTTLQATNKKRNFLYADSKGNYRVSDKIDRNFNPIDKESKEKWDAIIEAGYKDEEEKKFRDEYEAMNNKYSADNKPRNLSTYKETNRWPMVSISETEFGEYTKNYCKRVYDYYIDKHPEYKDYRFEFIRGIYGLWFGVKNGDEVVTTVSREIEVVDGPVFEKSRSIHKFGEYTEVEPT